MLQYVNDDPVNGRGSNTFLEEHSAGGSEFERTSPSDVLSLMARCQRGGWQIEDDSDSEWRR